MATVTKAVAILLLGDKVIFESNFATLFSERLDISKPIIWIFVWVVLSGLNIIQFVELSRDQKKEDASKKFGSEKKFRVMSWNQVKVVELT